MRRPKIVCVCDKAVGAPDLTLRVRPWPTNGGRARHACNNARIVQNRTADGILRMRKHTRTINQAPNIRFFFLARNCNRNITSRGFRHSAFTRSPLASLNFGIHLQLSSIFQRNGISSLPACCDFSEHESLRRRPPRAFGLLFLFVCRRERSLEMLMRIVDCRAAYQ